jgi:hypothetical protein
MARYLARRFVGGRPRNPRPAVGWGFRFLGLEIRDPKADRDA